MPEKTIEYRTSFLDRLGSLARAVYTENKHACVRHLAYLTHNFIHPTKQKHNNKVKKINEQTRALSVLEFPKGLAAYPKQPVFSHTAIGHHHQSTTFCIYEAQGTLQFILSQTELFAPI